MTYSIKCKTILPLLLPREPARSYVRLQSDTPLVHSGSNTSSNTCNNKANSTSNIKSKLAIQKRALEASCWASLLAGPNHWQNDPPEVSLSTFLPPAPNHNRNEPKPYVTKRNSGRLMLKLSAPGLNHGQNELWETRVEPSLPVLNHWQNKIWKAKFEHFCSLAPAIHTIQNQVKRARIVYSDKDCLSASYENKPRGRAYRL
jgi:hypothetical protein